MPKNIFNGRTVSIVTLAAIYVIMLVMKAFIDSRSKLTEGLADFPALFSSSEPDVRVSDIDVCGKTRSEDICDDFLSQSTDF